MRALPQQVLAFHVGYARAYVGQGIIQGAFCPVAHIRHAIGEAYAQRHSQQRKPSAFDN